MQEYSRYDEIKLWVTMEMEQNGQKEQHVREEYISERSISYNARNNKRYQKNIEI